MKTSKNQEIRSDTVLVVCHDDSFATEIMGRLFDCGHSAIGPVSNARLALALTAQGSPTVALVAQRPTGRRNASELAASLLREWDVPSLVLCHEPAKAYAAPWAPRPEQVKRLLRALSGMHWSGLALA